MAVVYSRDNKDGVESHFGTSGYTMNRTFVLFDRETESVWYPGKDGALNAVSGPRKGDKLPPVAKSELINLDDWLKKYPDSKILLPAPRSKTVHQIKRDETRPDKGTLPGKP